MTNSSILDILGSNAGMFSKHSPVSHKTNAIRNIAPRRNLLIYLLKFDEVPDWSVSSSSDS
jgi:hypothetical protein